MRYSITSFMTASAMLLPLVSPSQATSSTKRGLCFVPNVTTPEDDHTWIQQPSDLTWYYNYRQEPSDTFQNLTQKEFEFIPTFWGSSMHEHQPTFANTVKALVHQGRNITHVFTFNEPEMSWEFGGANMAPSAGARLWLSNIPALQSMGIKAGLPATAGTSSSLTWLEYFLGNCSEMISEDGERRNCNYDFVPFHHYGDFQSLASVIGQYSATFPDTPLWVTEFNYHNQPLQTTESFYQTATEYLDRLPSIERYALFGAFRSDVSNVGPNAAMLNDRGQLTDIGLWYLGRSGSGASPVTGREGRNDQNTSGGPAIVASALAIVLLAFLAV